MSIFTKIINGEIPCYKVAENKEFIAFLDINPNAAGHTLVVPKKEVDKLFDLDDDLYIKLFEYSKKIAIAIEKAIACERVGLSVIGLEVPHVHVHLIPLNSMADATFGKKEKLTPEEFKAIAENISSYL
ncbi:HIT family protein [Wenyingzhuangia sp. 2_MG-2023]|uniref:HIT family protein n=1 Tax=Wenyingzhuangia sp. 2_MG-2023 TaxID=3062639 RepID=UPI0026E33BBD|nr:HIT domain-containing protein [Wenyingzhuangia sp. 2_MG-2023]MDO6736798.1 HIT domain-containing protein [Wenyingzhuangia sp. 2_MG-2023]